MELLLTARTCVRPSATDAFNAWYDRHIPKRLEAAGFTSCTRLVREADPCETIALYTIRAPEDLPSLLAEDIRARDPALQKLAQIPAPDGIIETSVGVYAFVTKHPREAAFNRVDTTLSIEQWDWAGEDLEHSQMHDQRYDQMYDQMYLAHVLDYPDHTAGFRLKRCEDPLLDYTNRAPANLTIIENPPDLAPSEITPLEIRKDKASLFKNRRVGLYCLRAKYWSA